VKLRADRIGAVGRPPPSRRFSHSRLMMAACRISTAAGWRSLDDWGGRLPLQRSPASSGDVLLVSDPSAGRGGARSPHPALAGRNFRSGDQRAADLTYPHDYLGAGPRRSRTSQRGGMRLRKR
jgi:hypothetical protein